jgi:iron(III) transport system substrate-binding protein
VSRDRAPVIGHISLAVTLLTMVACSPSAAPAAPPTAVPPAPAAATIAPASAASTAPAAPTAAAASGANPAAAANPAGWDQVIADAKKEGTVVFSFSPGGSDTNQRLADKFKQMYGIDVQLAPAQTEFPAKMQTEMAAGKVSTDIRSGGSTECRNLANMGLTQSFGDLPISHEPTSTFGIDPLLDVKGDHQGILFDQISVYFLVVNNQLFPPDQGPNSYKDLADPKYKGQILLMKPGGASFGTVLAASVFPRTGYGVEYYRALLGNTRAVTTSVTDGIAQTVSGAYGIFAHTISSGAQDVTKIPEPRPVRLVAPSDGLMGSIGALCFMKGAPHPNAAKLYLNFLVAKDGQTVMAGQPGEGFIRKDLTSVTPELTPWTQPGVNWFYQDELSYDFQTKQYLGIGDQAAGLLPEFNLS